MRWFTEVPSQALRFAVSDAMVWATAWIVVALAVCLLILIATKSRRRDIIGETTTTDLTMSGVFRVIRRHSSQWGVHTLTNDATTILPHIERLQLGRHWALTNTQWHDSEHPLDARETGAHAAGNPTRVLVPNGWTPMIGTRRIAFMTGTTL